MGLILIYSSLIWTKFLNTIAAEVHGLLIGCVFFKIKFPPYCFFVASSNLSYLLQAANPKKTFSPPEWIKSFCQTFTIGGVLLGGLIVASYLLEGSAKFIFSTWGFM